MAKEKITAETEVGTTELACVLGITGRRVRQLVEDGQLNKSARGRFLLADTVQQYIRFSSGEPIGEDAAELELAKQKADVALKEAKAKIASMEALELQGKMHRSEDVESLTEDLIYTMRSALLALPGRLAVDVSSAANSAEAADIIRREVHKVMQEISEYHYDPRRYGERVRERRNWSGRDDEDC